MFIVINNNGWCILFLLAELILAFSVKPLLFYIISILFFYRTNFDKPMVIKPYSKKTEKYRKNQKKKTKKKQKLQYKAINFKSLTE